MPAQTPFEDLPHLIQLSIAPVFLLTALGTFLGVLGTRLARVVDRARAINERLRTASKDEQGPLRTEFAVLVRRRRLVNLALTAATCAALLVCVLIASTFVGFIVGIKVALVVAALFILAVLAFVAALVLFLREVLLATSSVHLDVR